MHSRPRAWPGRLPAHRLALRALALGLSGAAAAWCALFSLASPVARWRFDPDRLVATALALATWPLLLATLTLGAAQLTRARAARLVFVLLTPLALSVMPGLLAAALAARDLDPVTPWRAAVAELSAIEQDPRSERWKLLWASAPAFLSLGLLRLSGRRVPPWAQALVGLAGGYLGLLYLVRSAPLWIVSDTCALLVVAPACMGGAMGLTDAAFTRRRTSARSPVWQAVALALVLLLTVGVSAWAFPGRVTTLCHERFVSDSRRTRRDFAGLFLLNQGERGAALLTSDLRHPDERVRAKAAQLLGALRRREAVPRFLTLVREDPSPQVRITAAWAADAALDPGDGDLVAALEQAVAELPATDVYELLGLLADQGPPGLRVLERQLEDGSQDLQHQIASVLWEELRRATRPLEPDLGRLLPAVLRAQAYRVPYVHEEVASQLARTRLLDEPAVAALLNDPALVVRRLVARSYERAATWPTLDPALKARVEAVLAE